MSHTGSGSCFLQIQNGNVVPQQKNFGNTEAAQKQHSSSMKWAKSAFVHLTAATDSDWKTHVLQADPLDFP